MIELDAHREMPFVRLEDDLVEVAITDDHVSQPAAIEIAALASNREQRRVNEQFFEKVRGRARSVQHAFTLRELDALSAAVRDIAYVRAQSEDRVAEIVHDKRLLRDKRGLVASTRAPSRLPLAKVLIRTELDDMSKLEASLAIGRGLPGRLRLVRFSHRLREASVGNEDAFVGLDVHARSVTGHALDAVTGEVWQRKLCPDPGEVLRWVSGLPGPVKVGYEAGPTGYGLYRCLNDHGTLCVVAAPSKLHRPHGDRVKTDARDAELLAHVLKLGEIVEVNLPSKRVWLVYSHDWYTDPMG